MPTYANVIQVRETALAIESLLVAPFGTTYSPTRIDVDNPPTGFIFMGAVAEETPQLAVTRERYQLRTGIPQVLQYQAVRGVAGTFTMAFIGDSNRLARYGLGNVSQLKTIVGSFGNAFAITSIDSAKTRVYVGTIAGFVAGDWLTAGVTATELITGDAEGDVSILTTADTPGWIQFTSPGFTRALTTSDKLAKVILSALPFGTKQLPNFHLIGVADFIDGVQVQHDMAQAAPTGEWTEQIRPDGAITVNTTWDLFGYSTARYAGAPGGSSKELIVGERFFVPKQ